MIERAAITFFPGLFAVIFIGTSIAFRRKHIDMDGVPPIRRDVFLLSKYAILILWVATVAQTWGARLSFWPVPDAVRWAACAIWAAGFVVLFLGLVRLGDSLRVGSPKEATTLKTDGLYRVSRNPMYVGVYLTLAAATLYTLNPIALAIAAFSIAVHHRIVLAEERFLQDTFGPEYQEYCRRVRRYL
jgi:protein-S-isoprenylcysteine O-methyltransferase Ste14